MVASERTRLAVFDVEGIIIRKTASFLKLENGWDLPVR